ncbi:MAG: hypothetical protein NTV94_04325 [Planctomycetota bacterium]|nr:hypothetical protein [Planctomycetota bacterium]
MSPIKSIVCGMVTSLAASTAIAQTWNPTNDFAADHGNPNGVWSYGWYPATLAGPFTPYSLHTDASATPLWGAWIGCDSTPAVWKNTTGVAQYGVGINQLSLHPGPGGEACCVRWSNPQGSLRGTVMVRGTFWQGDSGWMQVGVRVDGVLEFQAGNSGSFELALNNRTVQNIEFLVWQGYAYGNTPLDVDVTFIPACSGDFNQDGGVDGADVDAFFEAWEAGDSAADINEDGGVDGGDVGTFFARWEAGC